MPIGQVASEIAGALCDNVAACYGAGVEIVMQGADCKQTNTDLFQDLFVDALEQSVKDGTITYDPLLAADCVAELAKASTDAGFKCLDVGKAAEKCKSALGKLGKANALCAHSFECQENLFCDTAAQCPGKCTAFLGTNAPCADSTLCGVGLTCFIPVSDDAGVVPAEVELMRNIEALRQSLEGAPDDAASRDGRQRLSEMQQQLALRLEKLRISGSPVSYTHLTLPTSDLV